MTLFRSWFPSKSVDSSLEARVTRAFSDGYLLAMQEGMKQLSESIRNAAIEESLTRLEPMIAERATALGNFRARETQELLAKRAEFQRKHDASRSAADLERYANYLQTLDWVLNANGLHPHQPVSQ